MFVASARGLPAYGGGGEEEEERDDGGDDGRLVAVKFLADSASREER